MSRLFPLSVLDLASIVQGSTPTEAFKHSIQLAQQADKAAFTRYWLAEHHNMAGIASAATSLVIAHVAQHTTRIRVGAGGIMLPNHSPLVIAEQFGTLASLFPGRIDLGVGRAPGSDPQTSRALRRNLDTDPNAFPQDVISLLDYLSDNPEQPITAIPGKGTNVPVWLLGSSLFGAQLAAMLGLPYAFASHFAPAQMMDAIAIYRSHFKPSAYLAKPYVMLGLNVFAAETDDKAHYLASSWQQAFVSARQGRPIQLPPPVANYLDRSGAVGEAMKTHTDQCAAIGSLETITEKIQAFIDKTQADEIIAIGNMFDINHRLHSFELLAQAHQQLRAASSSL